MTTTLLATTTVSAEDFATVISHGRKMALAIISSSIATGVGIPYVEWAVFRQPLPVLRGWGYPREKVAAVLGLPIDVQLAIVGQLAYDLAADEED